MLMVYKTKAGMGEKIQAVTHAGGSGRLQTVRREWNPLYYRAVELFGEEKIVVVVYVPNGYRGGLSCYVARDILTYYFDQKKIVAKQTIPDPGSLVYENLSETKADNENGDRNNFV